MTANCFAESFVVAASIVTPISSGNGEAIIKQAAAGRRYFFILFEIALFNFLINFSLDNFLTSSLNEILMNLKINKSARKAPNPPIKPAMTIFGNFEKIRRLAVAGIAVNP